MNEPKTLAEARALLRHHYPGEYVSITADFVYYPSSDREEAKFKAYRANPTAVKGEQAIADTPGAAVAELLELSPPTPRSGLDVTAEGEIIAHDAPGVPAACGKSDECPECGWTHEPINPPCRPRYTPAT